MAKFKPGVSANPAGRPKGAVGKFNGTMRERLTDFLQDNYAQFMKDYMQLEPRDRVRYYLEVVPYETAKAEPEHKALSDDEKIELLDMLEARLKQSHENP